jgi:hypothetical protein
MDRERTRQAGRQTHEWKIGGRAGRRVGGRTDGDSLQHKTPHHHASCLSCLLVADRCGRLCATSGPAHLHLADCGLPQVSLAISLMRILLDQVSLAICILHIFLVQVASVNITSISLENPSDVTYLPLNSQYLKYRNPGIFVLLVFAFCIPATWFGIQYSIRKRLEASLFRV